MLIDVEEVRLYGGEIPRHGGKKQRSSKGYFKSDRLPTALHDEIYINGFEDYRIFIPENLPRQFTVKDFAKITCITDYTAGWALHLLSDIGVLERVGKQGKAYLYERRI